MCVWAQTSLLLIQLVSALIERDGYAKTKEKLVDLGEVQGPDADALAVPPALGCEVDQGPLTEYILNPERKPHGQI